MKVIEESPIFGQVEKDLSEIIEKFALSPKEIQEIENGATVMLGDFYVWRKDDN